MTSALLASLITLVLVLTCILCYVYVGFVLFDPNEISGDGRSASSTSTKSSSSPSSSFSFRNTESADFTSGPIVSTTSGKVEGFYHEILGKKIEVFLGIPYATPPIGSFRFARTNPVIKWRQTLKAVKPPPICLQFKSPDIDLPWVGNDPIEESEDCLKLNIWTPSSSMISKNRTRPTIIWIHGGGFVSGQWSEWSFFLFLPLPFFL